MNIEEEIFKKTKIDYYKLIKYGFIKDKDIYKYSKKIMHNNFRVDIIINKNNITGKVIDLSLNEEYTNFRMKELGIFSSQVKEEYINILNDIKNNCFIKKYFIYDQANRITNYIIERYHNEPLFEWDNSPGFATFKNNNKWYGLIMNIDINKLDHNLHKEVEIINIKLDPYKIIDLIKLNGFYLAYHMNKKHWISIILNDTIKDEIIMNLIEESYHYTL